MLKKIFIYNLLLIFFVSTAGLPFSIHFCSMMGQSSFEDCEMCNVETVEVKISCCKEDENAAVKIGSESKSVCCEIQVIENSVKDKFIFNKFDLKINYSFFFIPTDISEISFSKSEILNYSDTSPPHLIDNHIYLINSFFLI